MKYLVLSFLLLYTAPSKSSVYIAKKPVSNDITGIWLTQSTETMIEVRKNGANYTGKIFWLKFPISPKTNKPKIDIENPDPNLRSRAIIGLNLLIDFTFSPEKGTGSGDIYDPKSGKTYNCKATLVDANTLKIRGYIGASWMGLGRTEVWKKIKN